ncbi:ProQ/FINO family protein [Phytohalomonas tamaricis]|uniref:ProQ/FINO family protein n=1 Tax=Phytohalomonas tamaricis TaxID=2081032 RepID=UPI0021D47EFB|nr:ProQ/FINO family protein [Phytohalomonas tamaricis]
MTDRLDTLIGALEQQAERAWAQLEETRLQMRALEAENRALKARLEAFEPLAGRYGQTQTLPVDEKELPVETESKHDNLDSEDAKSNNSRQQDDEIDVVSSDSNEARALNSDDIEVSSNNRSPDTSLHTGTESAPEPSLQEGSAPSPQALLKQWYRRYPKTFFKGHTRPLQIGIHEQLARREQWPDKLIKRALAGYVNLPRYLKSVRAGALRVDLDGQNTEAVTEQDAQHAREQLSILQERQREREAQKASQRMADKLSALTSKHGH